MENIPGLQGIPFILEKIKWIHWQKNQLSDEQKEKIKHLPYAKREKIKKKILKRKEEEKQDLLYIWVIVLEEKAKEVHLPKKIVDKILELATSIKNGESVHNIEASVEELKISVVETSQKENLNTDGTFRNLTKTPFVQVRYTKEKFDKAVQDYFQNKLLPDLVMAGEKPIVPVEVKREYPKKKGSQYPKAQIELEQKHEEVWKDLLVKKTQEAQKEAGKPIQKPEEILTSLENMIPYRQRKTIEALQNQNLELLQQQKMEEKAQYEAQLKKNIERQRRKKAIKEAKRKKGAEKQVQKEVKKTSPKKTNIKKILKGQSEEQQKSPKKAPKGLLSRLEQNQNKTTSIEPEYQRR